MKDDEHKEQSLVVRWFRLQYPKFVLYATPNGGLRHIRTASKLKDEGVLPGVADLFLRKACKGKHGLYIEMKAKGGRLTDMQKYFIDGALEDGYEAKVCYGFEDAKRVIEEYLN